VHDTAAASRLLDDAGWVRGRAGMREARNVTGVADGTPLRIGFSGFPSHAQFGELLRAQLRAVGVELRLELTEPAVFVERVFTERNFDTAMVSYCNGTDPEIGARRMYDSRNIAPVPFSNAAGYRDGQVDSMFALAGSTLDIAERRRLYHAIQRRVARDLPYLWLVESVGTRAHSSRCTGFGSPAHFAATARCGS
jgi:peptide/nickel transport system substrate-binding protein